MSSVARDGWARDADIRETLRNHLRDIHAGEPDVFLVEEMGLCEGQARIDMGVINGSIIGFEIKSPRDSLVRLPGQIDVYSRTLDQVEVVTCTAHLEGVLAMVPGWWGVSLVVHSDCGLALEVVQPAAPNPGWDPMSLVQLLWRDEVLEVLTELGLDRGFRTKPKFPLWERLVASVSEEELHGIVLRRLKSRDNWPTARPLA